MRRALAISAVLVLAVGPARASPLRQLRRGNGASALLSLSCPGPSDLACVTGETITIARTGDGATCMDQGTTDDTRVAAVTGDNTACHNSTLGTRVVGAIRNELGGSETFNDSVVDWLPTLDAASVTLDQDDSPLAGTDTLADTLSDGSAVAAQFIRQALALSTAGRYQYAKWLRHTSEVTSTLEVEVNTSPTPTVQTCNASVLTTYKRFSCNFNATGLSFTQVTGRTYPRQSTMVTPTGAVFAWGAQTVGPATTTEKTAARPLPYCRSLGASGTTCAADALDLGTSEGNFSGSFSVGIDFTPMSLGAGDFPAILSKRPWSTATDLGWAISHRGLSLGNDGQLGAHFADGTSGVDVATVCGANALVIGTTKRIGAQFRKGVSVKLFLDGVQECELASVFSGNPANSANTMSIGWDSPSGSRRAHGFVKNIRFYKGVKSNP